MWTGTPDAGDTCVKHMGHLSQETHGYEAGNRVDGGGKFLIAEGGNLPSNPAGSWGIQSNLGHITEELLLVCYISSIYEAKNSHYGAY